MLRVENVLVDLCDACLDHDGPPLENRVGGLAVFPAVHVGLFVADPLESQGENRFAPMSLASDVGFNLDVYGASNPLFWLDPLGLDARIIWEHFLQKGHAQIAVDVYDSAGDVVGEKVYGFRPTDVPFKYLKVLLGIDILGIAQEESRIPDPEQIDNMPLSPTATHELQQIIEKNLGPEPYDMYDKNCIHWINRILEEAIERFNKMNEEYPK